MPAETDTTQHNRLATLATQLIARNLKLPPSIHRSFGLDKNTAKKHGSNYSKKFKSFHLILDLTSYIHVAKVKKTPECKKHYFIRY